MNASTQIAPELRIDHGRILTTSLNVAQVFDKQHTHVLRTIKDLDCSEEFRQSNFGSASYLDGQGKPRPMFDMTRDGWTFLVMGFTGPKAAAVKEAYIRAFNAMEKKLLGAAASQPPLPETITLTKDAYLALQAERIDLLKARIELLELKAQPRRRLFSEAEKAHILARAAQGAPARVIAGELDRPQDSIEGFLYQRKHRGGAQ